MPPPEVLIPILVSAGVSAAVAFGAWPWRDRGWPLPVALGAGFATAYAWAHRGVPGAWPVDTLDFLFHIAVAGAIWGAAEAGGRVPLPARWIVRVALCAAATGLLLKGKARWSPGELALWTAGVATAIVGLWTLLQWRGRTLTGAAQPVTLLVAAVGAAVAFKFAKNGRFGQLSGALAAAAGPLCVLGLVHGRLPSSRIVPPAVLLLGSLLVAGKLFGGNPLPWASVALLAFAPLAAHRRWWVGALAAAALAALAAYLAHQANLPDPNDPYADYY